MTREEAISLLKQVCAAYKGTLKEHELLQQALSIIAKEEKK